MTTSRSRSSTLLEPPPPGAEQEDPGAQELASDNDMGHSSDAPAERLGTQTPSPIPRTRVEKVDDSPRYGEVPGSPASQARVSDAVPHEIAIVGENPIKNKTREPPLDGSSASASPVPRTVVEEVDQSQASYGDIPGTPAYEARLADAVPDSVIQIQTFPPEEPLNSAQPGLVLETLVSRIESPPLRDGSSPDSFKAHRRSPSDALADAEETISDVPEIAKSTNIEHDDDDEFGDDFDTFEAGVELGENDDFDDFDDTFEQPTSAAMDETSQDLKTSFPEQTSTPSVPPVLNFDSLKSLPDLITATTGHLDTLFPKSANLSSLPPVDPVSNSSIFTTERSLSLWSQLVAPPPLQPPNWTKSRIRRLFLVSLGVPVDLDEILPASKQKKLVLPSINLESNNGSSATEDRDRSRSRSKKDGQQRSSTSTDLGRSPSRTRRRRGQPPPPELDISAVHRLCATTDAALDGFTDEELREHVATLERMTVRASEVLEYWLRRRDGQLGEKEAFEGVIENLVKHARQVRK